MHFTQRAFIGPLIFAVLLVGCRCPQNQLATKAKSLEWNRDIMQLMEAIADENSKAIAQVLQRDPDVFKPTLIDDADVRADALGPYFKAAFMMKHYELMGKILEVFPESRDRSKLFDISKEPQINLLWMAALANDVKTVTYLLKEGYDPNTRTRIKQGTCLHDVILLKNLAMISLLLEHGADINATNVDGETPLHVSAYALYPDTVDLLVSRSANLAAKDGAGYTPLRLSCRRKLGRYDRHLLGPKQLVVERLLKKAAGVLSPKEIALAKEEMKLFNRDAVQDNMAESKNKGSPDQ